MSSLPKWITDLASSVGFRGKVTLYLLKTGECQVLFEKAFRVAYNCSFVAIYPAEGSVSHMDLAQIYMAGFLHVGFNWLPSSTDGRQFALSPQSEFRLPQIDALKDLGAANASSREFVIS